MTNDFALIRLMSTPAKQTASQAYFPHIDGLRALAVIAVIVFHLDESFLPGGYLGVDLFYVLSGFVITGYLSRINSVDIRRSLLEFYVRRFKRLMPALLLSIIVMSAAFLLLTSEPPIDTFWTAAAATVGMANNYLYLRSADYFALDPTLNPFTHTWSLGVEEQFYIIYPALLIFLGLAIRTKASAVRGYVVLSVLGLASMMGFILLSSSYPTAVFYLLPFRFWELLAGALAYYYFTSTHDPESTGRLKPLISLLAMAGMILCFMAPEKYQVIATLALVVCALPILLDHQKNSLIKTFLSFPALVWIGLISYSLYIWHWPILVLSKNIVGVSHKTLVITVPLILIMAVSSYYLVERPLRYAKFKSTAREGLVYLGTMAAIAFLLASVAPGLAVGHNNFLARTFGVPPVEAWTGDVDCHGEPDLKLKSEPIIECLGPGDSPVMAKTIYLYGDSHAAQLYFMFDHAMQGTEYRLAFINDGSIPNLIRGKVDSASLNYIVDHVRPGDIVALAFHRGRLNESRDRHIRSQKAVERSKRSIEFQENFEKFYQKIVRRGATVMLLRDTPLMNSVISSPSCRLQTELFGSNACEISLEQDLLTRTRQDRIFDHWIKSYPGTCSWDPLPSVYRGSERLDVVDETGNYIMLDWNHITKYESVRLAEFFKPVLMECMRSSRIADAR